MSTPHPADRQRHAAPTELTLVRHGQTEWHAENRYAGSSDVALDAVGVEQAERLGRWAADHPHHAVAVSTLSRAQRTAAPAARALGVAPEIVPELREVHFGLAEGRTLAEVEAGDPEVAAAFRADPVRNAFPGAEPPAEAADRLVGALHGLAERHPGQRVLVVAHNTVLRLALCRLLGIDLSEYRRVLPRLDNVALTRVRMPRGPERQPPALLGFNIPIA